jgi:glyoxylase-like metal-dependent hydrolase (beta-lactamase superfamily II)
MTTPPRHEVYAIRYATVDRAARENFLHPPRAPDAPMPMDYFVWLVRGGGRALVVDTGFGEDAAARRKRRLLQSPAAGLAALGVDAASVQDVVITHLHYDHAGQLALFPRARLHVQDDEVAFATGRAMVHASIRGAFDGEDVAALVRQVHGGRVQFHDGDATLGPGISLHRIGGHTRGLQVLRVSTERGWVVLASDATHFAANLQTRNPFPIFVDLQAMLEGYDRLLALASSPDHVVPGHDPEVLRRYPLHPAGQGEIACLHAAPGPASDPNP